MEFDIPEILDRLGYPIAIRGENCVCDTSYRGGDTKTGLYVNKSGFCYDQVQDRTFPLVELVSDILGSSTKDAQVFINSNQSANYEEREKEVKISVDNKFDPKYIEGLTPSYKFYLEKGISKKTLQDFNGGLSHSGKMYLRFVFPIYDKAGKVWGAAGRDVSIPKEEEKNYTNSNRPRPKWKNLGEKKNFLYPLFISSPYISKTRQVVIVESIGDCLSLWNSGIKNVFCLFGLSMSDKQLIGLVAENPKEILLATNNDFSSDKNRGVEAAAKVRTKLAKMFSLDKIRDAFPDKNDFGDQTIEENHKWAEKNKVRIFKDGE